MACIQARLAEAMKAGPKTSNRARYRHPGVMNAILGGRSRWLTGRGSPGSPAPHATLRGDTLPRRPACARSIISGGEIGFVRFWRGVRFKYNDEANPAVFGT